MTHRKKGMLAGKQLSPPSDVKDAATIKSGFPPAATMEGGGARGSIFHIKGTGVRNYLAEAL